MKIILESSSLLHPLTGIGRYTHELSMGLSVKKNMEVQYWVQNRLLNDLDTVKRLKPRTHFPLWSKPFRVLKNKYLSNRHRSILSKTIVHGPNFFIPKEAERGIITVHDLSILRYPETHPKERLRSFDLHLERSISQAQKILADSEYIRQEIIKEFSCIPDKVHTVYMGVSPQFKPAVTADCKILKQYGLTAQSYTLCVATLEPRKNITKLLTAYQKLPNSLRNRYPLVLVGGKGWLADDILQAIHLAESQGWVKKLGYVAEEDLLDLYQNAHLFAYIPTYEGFGLPVLESMACGVPVITSNRSSLPEVAGKAALSVNPDNLDELVESLHQGLEDELWRHDAITEGMRQAAKFSWQRCVDETLSVYQMLENV